MAEVRYIEDDQKLRHIISANGKMHAATAAASHAVGGSAQIDKQPMYIYG